MNTFEVPTPIINSPYEEPVEHWDIREGEPPVRKMGRQMARYRVRIAGGGNGGSDSNEVWAEIKLVNRLRQRVREWRQAGYPGATRTTRELLEYWRRDGRQHRLFYAQREAVETVVFLTEARADLLQGIEVPWDEPGDDRKALGFRAFRRYACKMATGTGKTTVMGMLAAWSILNKCSNRQDGRFSDAVLIVCPNVTIRDRLRELNPGAGEASLFRTRDLVPPHLMPQLSQGRVLVTNWHVFQPHTLQVGAVGAKVTKLGVADIRTETITIGAKTTTARGTRYLTLEDYEKQVAAGLLAVREEIRDKAGNLTKVVVESIRYVEGDSAVLRRVLDKDLGAKKNILVLNDEAHHAYRIRRLDPDAGEADVFGEEDEAASFIEEATVWIEGLDLVHKHRGINFCVDLSATPYYLARAGMDTDRIFPWVVSDFGLTEAIESGLVKIPQLAVRDSTGAPIPGYKNIWSWILPRLTPAERGGKQASPKPEAVLKWANAPIAMLGGLWEQMRLDWEGRGEDPRPPVFILVCKNTRIAKVIHEWLAEDRPPPGIPSAGIPGLVNRDDLKATIRVDSKVVHETDTDQGRSAETAWMRFTLDTVGKLDWPRDSQGRPLYPEGFEELARKLGKPLHPPGRDVRCIVSVGMLTEGWDCNTVTHIVGLRPFMSQLLCEQVVGRALRRASYDVDEDGLLSEEVAKIFGVPFDLVPFKAGDKGQGEREKRHHVRALPVRADLAIAFPRVEGYRQAVRDRVAVDWDACPRVVLDPTQIPPEVDMKAALPSNQGRFSLSGPGALERVSLSLYRQARRYQALVFDLAGDLTRMYAADPGCEVPPHRLFPQMVAIARRYLEDFVIPTEPFERVDAFCSPYYGWILERLVSNIHPDTAYGEQPELPRFERHRPPGSTADVDFWTSRAVKETVRSHVNFVAADTRQWEQSAAFAIDNHEVVAAFVKNAGLGFAIPYVHNGEPHDYIPDFIVRLRSGNGFRRHLILETKGFDPLAEVKSSAARRWVAAVNAEGSFGKWKYEVARSPGEVPRTLREAATAVW